MRQRSFEHNQQSYSRRNFDSSHLQMQVKTLTHDYYMIELPQKINDIFYKQFPFYLDQLDYKGSRILIAPVARLYGTNQFGQKCCLHVHGYFSHFYIKADEFAQAMTNDRQFVKQFLGLVQGLYQRAYSTNKPIIMNGIVEHKLDFYGYHEKPQAFLKIVVYDPSYIVKLRELLDSQIVAGRVFQCYQAHINYFMQLFSDNNIYGSNEINIIQFTFRKNLSQDLMDLFKKMNTLTKKIFMQGYDIIEIEKQHPQMFNNMQKLSSCYIQIDLSTNSILNNFAPQHDIIDSHEENSIDSEIQIQKFQGGQTKLKFQVKITKALLQIWEDQRRRRQVYGIQSKLQGFIDYSKNIQGKNILSSQRKDPLWVNFIKKGNNLDQIIQMIKTSLRGDNKKQTNQLQICRQIAENYRQTLQNQREKLIQKVMNRWKYYGSRKRNILEQIVKGQRDELPQWDDDKNLQQQSNSDRSQNQNQQECGELNQSVEAKSQVPKLKNAGNILLYRNNYKHYKASLKKGSYFYICTYCKSIAINCKCQQLVNSFESTQETLIKKQQRIPSTNYQDSILLKYTQAPPTFSQVSSDYQIKIQRPFYSNYKDLFLYHKISPLFQPCLKNAQILDRQLKKIKDYNRQPITIKNQLKLPYYFKVHMGPQNLQTKILRQKKYRIKYLINPPSQKQIIDQFNTQQLNAPTHERRSTSIKISKQDTFVTDLVVFHYEFLVGFQANNQRYYGDPQKDEIICFSFHTRNFQQYRKNFKSLIMIEKYVKKQSLQVWQYDDIYFVQNEYHLISMVISCICRLDPDLMVTYDQQKRGIRYLTQRGFAHGINFQSLTSRSCDLDQLFQYLNFKQFKTVKQVFLTRQILLAGNILQAKAKNNKTHPQLAFLQLKLKNTLKRKPVLRQKYKFDLQIKGRVNVCLYRICQQQLKLDSYTQQNVCKHLFNQQLSQYTDKDLFQFYSQLTNQKRQKENKDKKISAEKGINFVLDYLNKRLELQAQIVVNLNIISVLVEKSKIYGSDLVSMMERGSQFKIQAIMCRVTKKLGYLTLSASKRQVGNQSILQCIPLVLQPPKQFFPEPVLLFDFQSLYPSIMIAYNLCYSTCLGSINNLFDKHKLKRLGVSQKMNVDINFLEQIFTKCDYEEAKKRIEGSIFITPNKVAFVKKDIREGILPRILLQFLISRIMIKNSEGLYKKAKIKKILKDRQYALKLFMNVMFGYTGASFTGRMPCSQIADSIVQLAKYCLRQAIDFLNNHPKYKGKVLYGDTDSIFFHLPGYKTSETFKIGKQLALQITAMFPYPIQMKFEKVYQGLFLVAKKRYYGKMYESETSPCKYQGKGLECIRRDGINLTRNLMRQMLDTLIDTRDLSLLKQNFKQQSARILNNQEFQSQFFLSKEVKLLKYSDKTCPAHGEAAKRLQKIDPMLVPKYGQRMKYFVINGGLKPLKNRSISVFQYFSQKNMSLDLDYYFRKQVLPPLQRVLSSLADLNQWSANIQYRHSFEFSQSHQLQINKKCLRCHGDTHFILCQKCFQFVDHQIQKHIQVCQDCTGCKPIAEQNKCVQWNCKQIWKRRTSQKTKKNVYPQLCKLRDAIKQLNF